MCITHISCFVELEKVLNMVGEVATRLKNRLDMIYGSRKDTNERMFSGAHETVLPLCSSARSIFNQLRNTTTRKASKSRVDSGAASSFSGRPNGRITGMDMRHLLLLLPFLLFDLLHDEVHDHNSLHGTSYARMKALLQTSLLGYWFCWSCIACTGAAVHSNLDQVIIDFNMS